MIKISYQIFIIFLITACGTSKSLKKVKNRDFSFSAKYFYNPKNEYLPSFLKSSENILWNEGLLRVGRENLNALEKKEQSTLIRGLSFCYQGDINTALKIFKQDYKNLKLSPIYWNQVGICYYLNQQYYKSSLYFKTSIEAFKLATKSQKPYVPALNNLAALELLKGNDDEALAIFKNALKYSSKAKTPRFNMARIYLSYGLLDEAAKILVPFERKAPRDVDVLSGLAYIALARGQLDKALAIYDKIPRKHHRLSTIGLGLTYIHATKKNIEVAKSVFNKTLRPPFGEMREYYENTKKYLKQKELEILRERSKSKSKK